MNLIIRPRNHPPIKSATNLKQAAFAAWFVLPFVGALAAETDFQHVTIAREFGKFLGWPANHGPMHAWGDELLAAFRSSDHLVKGPNQHTDDATKPQHVWLARSRDGGSNWLIGNRRHCAATRTSVPCR